MTIESPEDAKRVKVKNNKKSKKKETEKDLIENIENILDIIEIPKYDINYSKIKLNKKLSKLFYKKDSAIRSAGCCCKKPTGIITYTTSSKKNWRKKCGDGHWGIDLLFRWVHQKTLRQNTTRIKFGWWAIQGCYQTNYVSRLQ